MEVPRGPAGAPGRESPSLASERVTNPGSEPAAAATAEGWRSSGRKLVLRQGQQPPPPLWPALLPDGASFPQSLSARRGQRR